MAVDSPGAAWDDADMATPFAKRQQGNELYRQQWYDAASRAYTEALDMLLTADALTSTSPDSVRELMVACHAMVACHDVVTCQVMITCHDMMIDIPGHDNMSCHGDMSRHGNMSGHGKP